MRRLFVASVMVLGVLCAPRPAHPCTTFLAQHGGQYVFGKNFDWNESVGMVVLNPRGLYKSSFLILLKDVPVSWRAVYGSVTFNQYGVEFPIGGVNEKGLVIENMILEDTQYPGNNGLPALNELQWMQWGLDSFATVAELAQAAPGVRVSPASAKLHYLACDATGACATFEYLKGALTIAQGDTLPVKALANDTYVDSCAYLSTVKDTSPLPPSSASLDRFSRAAVLSTQGGDTTVPAATFAILDNVAQSMTVWSQVYALGDGVVYFRTRKSPTIKSLPFASLPYDTCTRKVMDIHTATAGDATPLWEDYSSTANLALVKQAISTLFTPLPENVVAKMVAYPDTCTCTQPVDAGVPDTRPASLPDAATKVAPPPSKSSGCAFHPGARSSAPVLAAFLALAGIVLRRRR